MALVDQNVGPIAQGRLLLLGRPFDAGDPFLGSGPECVDDLEHRELIDHDHAAARFEDRGAGRTALDAVIGCSTWAVLWHWLTEDALLCTL